MNKIKNFMKRINWYAFLGKACLAAVLVGGILCASVYNSERHAEMQAKAQAEAKEKETLSKEPAEPTARRMEDTEFGLVDSQNGNGLSQDDIVSYSIAENELSLHRDIFAGKIKDEELLTKLDNYIEWLEGLKEQRFEDFLLSERIDDEIDMITEEKEIFKEGIEKDSVRANVCEAMLHYFQECRKNNIPFKDAAAQELAPELG